jgi:hypothetical protein
MKPDAIYYFSRIPEYQTRYKQTGHRGRTISGFPSIYKNGKYKGEQYIIFRKTSNYFKQGEQLFSHALELSKSQIITRLAFLPEYPRQSYGAYKDYGILIEFSENFDQLAIWFFIGLQEATPVLFQRKQAGQIPEIVKTEVVKLRYEANSVEW